MKILLGDFKAAMGRENIFKPTIGSESLQQDNNDNGVRIVNVDTSKYLFVKNTMFLPRNIHKYNWTSPCWNNHKETDSILIDRRRHSSILDVRSFRGADCGTDQRPVVVNVRERWERNKKNRIFMVTPCIKDINPL